MKALPLVLVLSLCCAWPMMPVRADVALPRETTPQMLTWDGQPMLPASYLSNWLGATLTVNRDTGQVLLAYRGRQMGAQLYTNAATVGGVPLLLVAPPVDVAGVVYLPLNSVAPILGIRAGYNTQAQSLALAHPTTGMLVTLPVRGMLLSTTADYDGDGVTETAYGAYLSFFNPYNVWTAGRSVSNPALPRIWMVKNGREIWGQTLDQNEIAQLSSADLTSDGRPELWVTTRLYGADYIGTNFRAYTWQENTFRNIIGTTEGYLTFTTSGGLLVMPGRRPMQLVLFDAYYDPTLPRVEGPVGLQVTTYTLQDGRFVMTDMRRSTGQILGRTSDVLRMEFGIPLTPEAFAATRRGEVGFL